MVSDDETASRFSAQLEALRKQSEEQLTARPHLEQLYGEPLGAEGKRARSHLLILSAFGLATTLGGLVPNQIEALGVTFSSGDKRRLFLLLALFILSALARFLFCAWMDHKLWKARLSGASAALVIATIRVLQEMPTAMGAVDLTALLEGQPSRLADQLLERHSESVLKQSLERDKTVKAARTVLDFVLPVLLGGAAVGLVVQHALWRL
ncbi:MAG: hypothetical protein R3325_14740 [Thermoanaerobaculia bacterium]|nr:hypothetical protein [Thermoanaerobaculia bacterium]